MANLDEHTVLSGHDLNQLAALILEHIQAQKAARVNSLEAFRIQRTQQDCLRQDWQKFTQEYRKIEEAMRTIPALPAWEHIQWAQTMLAMPNLAFMEIDTTGLDFHDEMIRFTLVDVAGLVIEDCLIKPATRELGQQASAINGIRPEQLADALPIAHVWERIQQALRGRYVISFAQEWDVEQLNRTATKHGLTPVLVIGECLQRRATRYYNGEYSLKLADLCERAGLPLPASPNQTSLDRARGQQAVLQAFAQAITDLRIPHMVDSGQAVGSNGGGDTSTGDDFDPFLDADDLP